MSGLRFLLGFGGPRAFWVLLGGVAVNSGMALMTPLFLKAFFDRCVASRDLRLFAALMAGFAVLAAAWRVLNFLQNVEVHRLKAKLLRALSSALLAKHYRAAPGGGEPSPGRGPTLILDEPLAASQAAVDLSLTLAASGASLAASLLLLAALSVPVTALLVVCMPLLDRLATSFGRQVKARTNAEKDEESRLRAFVARAARADRTVRLFGLHAGADAGLSERLGAYAARSEARARSSFLHNALSGIVLSQAELFVLALCGAEMMRGTMTFGGFMAYMSGFWTAAAALRGLTQRLPDLAKADALAARLEGALRAPDAPERAEGTLGAELSGVVLARDGRPVLRGVDLAVAPDERLRLVGPNGSGKTTVADLLAGFLAPDAGVVSAPPLRRVSACPTRLEFLPGSVREHLGYDRLDPASRLSLDALLEDFNLGGLLDRDPDGLSAGERKKVALAMALSKDADLYVLDEPLANVDEASKPLLVRRILERTAGRALVVALHGDHALWPPFDRVVRLCAPEASKPFADALS